jgi:hypothetical protein
VDLVLNGKRIQKVRGGIRNNIRLFGGNEDVENKNIF